MRAVAGLALLLALSGCPGTPTRLPAAVDAVLVDSRPDDGDTRPGYDNLTWNLIPLLPWFVSGEYVWLDQSHWPTLRESLQARIPAVTGPGDAPEARRVVGRPQLRLELLETRVVTRGINYGLGPLGFLVHWLLPSNSSHSTVRLRLTLRRAGQADVVAEGSRTTRAFYWYFYESPQEGEEMDAAVRGALDEAAGRLERAPR